MKHIKVILLLITLILISSNSSAENFKKKFKELGEKKDAVKQIALLRKWEKTSPNDAELFVAYFNYYIQKSMNDMISLDRVQKGEHSFAFEDSTGQVAGYLNNHTEYEPKNLQKAFDYIDKGIKAYPDRLDMRFGKIYMLGKIPDYRKFTDEIIRTIDYSSTNKNVWQWTDNKPQETPKEFMLASIQDYVLQLYHTNDDALLDNMIQISEAILKYYPEHIESLSNVSVAYLLKKNYDKGLEPLLRAEKIAPTDYIVLNNIAQAY